MPDWRLLFSKFNCNRARSQIYEWIGTFRTDFKCRVRLWLIELAPTDRPLASQWAGGLGRRSGGGASLNFDPAKLQLPLKLIKPKVVLLPLLFELSSLETIPMTLEVYLGDREGEAGRWCCCWNRDFGDDLFGLVYCPPWPLFLLLCLGDPDERFPP